MDYAKIAGRRMMRKAIVGFMFGAILAGSVGAMASHEDGPMRYRRTSPNGPERIILRHCKMAEDSMAVLKVVDYAPSEGKVIYRCRKPSSY